VGQFYREVLDEGARDRLTSNIAGSLVAAQVRQRALYPDHHSHDESNKMIVQKWASR
jgi:hypothetical protein